MEIDFKKCSEEELWKFVAVHLKSHGIDSVLVGGAVVAVYSDGAYRSGDLDLVLLTFFQEKIPAIMQEIGFKRKGGRHYLHPECQHLYVEFPSGPLGIGDDYEISPAEIECEGKVIKILTPTDCVKDRLATYMYFHDREGLEQAVLVAKRQHVDLTKIKAWCEKEGRPEVYKELVGVLN